MEINQGPDPTAPLSGALWVMLTKVKIDSELYYKVNASVLIIEISMQLSPSAVISRGTFL